MSGEDGMVIRKFRAEDRAAVRRICCDTGFLGKAIDPVFEDRDLFADFLTAYYTDEEPENAVVLEEGGAVRGYILAACDPGRQRRWDRRRQPGLVARALWRYAVRYGGESRRFVRWILWRGWREVPAKPDGVRAHFHINLLPEYKNVGRTRAMIDFFLEQLVEHGEEAVYGQMVVFEKRRGGRMFARYGFEVRDCVEVTKYKHLVDHPVFLFTVVKDLRANTRLYGKDLYKEKEGHKDGNEESGRYKEGWHGESETKENDDE